MPDKARDGQNVALKCQGFHGALDRPTKDAGRSDDKSVILPARVFHISYILHGGVSCAVSGKTFTVKTS